MSGEKIITWGSAMSAPLRRPAPSTSDLTQPVLCLGEALIDVIIKNEGQAEHVGGSPLNVACGLARLGHDTQFASWWGRDARGDRIAEHLTAHGVTVLPGSDGASRTSTALAKLDATGQASYEFDLDWQLPQLPPGFGGHLHTGSIAATLAPGADDVLAAVRGMAERTTISYDPNARPAIMGSASAVLPRIEELIGLADLVKASDEDLAWLYPDLPVDAVARRWLDARPGLVVITRGSAGASAWLAAEPDSCEVAGRRVPAVDTVGAGDSFMAGLISGLLDASLLGSTDAKTRLRQSRWADVRPALDRAAATAALTVSRQGAYSPTRAELVAD